MDLHLAWISAGKDLRRRMRDPLALLLWIGVPLVIGVLISAVSGDGKVRPRGRILIADLDDSLASRAVTSAFSQGELGKMFAVESVAIDAGRARIHDGDGSALLVVPQGFGEALLRDQPCKLELVKNPEYKILPKIAEEILGLAVDAVFYAQRIACDRLRGQLEQVQAGPQGLAKVMPDVFIADFSVEINRTVERLTRYLDPLAIEVESEPVPKAEPDSPRSSFANLFFPTMLFMALFFIGQGLSEDFWREKSLGTLRRANQTPGGLGPVLLGKFLAAAILIACIGVFALVLAELLLGVPLWTLPIALVWFTLSGTFLFACMALIQVFAASQRGGNLLTNSVLFPLTMLGGAFFPFEVMPTWMAAIGRRTPNGWALEEFKSILYAEADFVHLGLGALGLLAVTTALFHLARRRSAGAFLQAG